MKCTSVEKQKNYDFNLKILLKRESTERQNTEMFLNNLKPRVKI